MNRNLMLAEMTAVTWVGAIARRAEHERVNALNQRRREEIYRMAALGHKAYFQTQGAAMASGTYGQLASLHQKAAQDAANAVGYFLQRAVSGLGVAYDRGDFKSVVPAAQPPQPPAQPVTQVTTVVNQNNDQQSDPYGVAGYDFGSV